MEMKTSIALIFFLSIFSYSFSQMNEYDFKREIIDIKGQWNSIELPDNLYSKINPNLSDIRVYGITSNNDTIEAPYILNKGEGIDSNTEVDFKLINQSKNKSGYFFSFRIAQEKTINQMVLNFKQTNYDWRIKLEGSHNQKEWFTIITDYRILSIKTNLSDYRFNKIRFPDSRYGYYRIRINANVKPVLILTKIGLDTSKGGLSKMVTVKRVQTTEDKKRKQTIIDLNLGMTIPVSKLKMVVKDKIDFYRPITIEYLTDSFKTEKRWYYNYSEVQNSTLSSIDKQEFEFGSCITNKLRITIDNNDNQSLKFDSFQVAGFKTILITRIAEPAKYYLCYGRKNPEKPSYDIEQFSYKISNRVHKVTLGNERFVNPNKSEPDEPLFINKAWLWAIMTIIILLLGWFTLKMIKKEGNIIE